MKLILGLLFFMASIQASCGSCNVPNSVTKIKLSERIEVVIAACNNGDNYIYIFEDGKEIGMIKNNNQKLLSFLS